MTVHFHLKNPKANESLIIARILWQNNQLPYSTKKTVEVKYWIQKNKAGQPVQRLKQTSSYPIYAETNRALDNIENDIKQVFSRFMNDNNQREPTKDELKLLLHTFHNRGKARAETKKLLTPIEYFDKFIADSEKGLRNNAKNGKALSANTIKTYRTALKHLKSWQAGKKQLEWQDINLDFYSDYTEYLMHEWNLTNNATGKDFTIIKVLCEEAYDAGVNKYDFFRSKRFKVHREETDSIYVNRKEIQALYSLDLAYNKKLAECRDLFVFACETGLRHSDYGNIKQDQLIDGTLHLKTKKGQQRLAIPLSPLAMSIVNKYNQILPKSNTVQVFNRNIKEVFQKLECFHDNFAKEISKGGKRIILNVPRYELAMSHTPRRSFATNEVLSGTPISQIMAITGHETEKSFWRYVKLNKNDYTKMYSQTLKNRQENMLKIA
jgi:integrase